MITIAILSSLFFTYESNAAKINASFYKPSFIAIDGENNIYVDYDQSMIRKITPSNIVTKFYDGLDIDKGIGPFAIDDKGDVYLIEQGTLKKINSKGVVVVIAEANRSNMEKPTQACFSSYSGIAVDKAGNIYVTSWCHNVFKISPTGIVTNLAGKAKESGSTNGTGDGARFNNPKGIAVDRSGNLYVDDNGNFTIRKITPTGIVTTIAGRAGQSGYINGTGADARFGCTSGIIVDKNSNLFVTDGCNSTIRKVTQTGIVTDFVGKSINSSITEQASSNSSKGIAQDKNGNLYVTDSESSTILKITPNKEVSTIGGPLGADALKRDHLYFVAASSVNFRSAPTEDAPIMAILPIGTNVTFLDAAKHKFLYGVCNDTLRFLDIKIPYSTLENSEWVCVETPAFTSEEGDIRGWVVADSLSSDMPRLETLIQNHDKTPKKNLIQRRNLAERAIALEPLSYEAQKRLINILTEIGDKPAIAGAKMKFAQYQDHKPITNQGGLKEMFRLENDYIEPLVRMEDGIMETWGIESGAENDFYNSGEIYYVYRGQELIGSVATIIQFNSNFPRKVPVRDIFSSTSKEIQGDFATNFILPKSDLPKPEVTEKHISIMKKMMMKSLKSKKILLEAVTEDNFSTHAAKLSKDGKIVLFSHVQIGSMNDAHYGGEDAVFETYFVLAEQQKNGTFKRITSADNLVGGCSFLSSIDMNDDGADELLFKCDLLEGSSSITLLTRDNGVWRSK